MTTSSSFASTPAFFEAKYSRDQDPWGFSSDAGELQRYDAILQALAHRRYARAFEPGCSIGVLTERLAGFCDAVEAIDFSPTAVADARQRCGALPQVRIRCAALPEGRPEGEFDLLVVSEIGYYFRESEWRAIFGELSGAVRAGGTILAAHWLGSSEDHILSGDQVHAVAEAQPGLRLELAERHSTFRLQRFVKL
jgi:SAM-dependent methyltransferase